MTIAQMRSYWRLLTNETDTAVIPDADIDVFLQRGCEELNNRVGYFYQDDTIPLVAGNAEYILDPEVDEVIWVYWHGQRLAKVDADELDQTGENWRDQPGAPKQYLVQGNTLILVPVPSGEAIAGGGSAGSLDIRVIATPATITAGPTKLQASEHPLPVYYAAVIYSAANPDSALAAHRIKHLGELFQIGSELARLKYEKRRLAR